MQKNMKRAWRRHCRARMVARAARLYTSQIRPQQLADNLAACSCWMCGNPRRHAKGRERFTRQELRRAIYS